MKTCPHCQATNAPDNRFCLQCGKPLDASLPPSDATVLLSATQLARGPHQQRFDVGALFHEKSKLVIGRAPDCDLKLSHPSVSRYHARLERETDGLYLTDLTSVNGTTVGGKRIHERTRISDGERVGIGPFFLKITGGVLQSQDNSRGMRLEAVGLEKVVPVTGGGTRKLLDDINLVVNPGEFVTLLGPSGSGKSTLMDALNGRRPATGGKVLANGEDFYRLFDGFRQSLGYVPQKDIVHTQLTVYRALYYTAQLRLPRDMEKAELKQRVQAVMKEMELEPHADTLVGNLSGGQIKRVSLGAELLGKPALLYIDEATSGLDAGTEARMMRLFRRLADEGRSIICITHNIDNVDLCHLILVLARGKVMYYGPPREAPRYFKVARVSGIYDRLPERDLADWERDFRATSLYKEFVVDRLAVSAAVGLVSAGGAPPAPAPAEPVEVQPEPEMPGAGSSKKKVGILDSSSRLMRTFTPLVESFRELGGKWLRFRELTAPVRESLHQFRVLTLRYCEMILSDRRSLPLLLLQAPIVAVFLLIGFAGKPFTRTMPSLRELRPEERETLQALASLGAWLDPNKPLTEEQKAALSRVELSAAGINQPVRGEKAVEMIRQLMRDDLSATQKRLLEQGSFTVPGDKGGSVTIKASQLVAAYRQFQRSGISEELLRIPGEIVPQGSQVNPRYTYILLFITVMIVLWFGCNNAAKEIVKEEAIYGRERAVNLRILPYLASKFLVQSLITIFHAGLLMLILFGSLELLAAHVTGHSAPPASLMLAYGPQFAVVAVLAMVGVALGLLLSACVNSPDRANALLPYVLIPQMILGGGILTVNTGLIKVLAMTLSPVYWAFRAVHLRASELPKAFPGYAAYPDGAWLPVQALLVQMVVLLVLTAWFLKRKDAA